MNKNFTVVGIGGSAGALGAFEQFFINMPADSGMAFILIQHLDPTRESFLPEIISRNTEMKVLQVSNGMAIEPDTVYVIPPNKEMDIADHHFKLSELPARINRFPIDTFFRGLAVHYRDRAVGIILSGMGSDGMEGVKEIKNKGGLVMVQSIESSTYDSMPRHAIGAGMVDYVLPVEDLPEKLINYVKHDSIDFPKLSPVLEEDPVGSMQKILQLVKKHTGHDFSMYKENTLSRRIERRMKVHNLERIKDYSELLQRNTKEIEILFQEMLIGVTNFFRDPEAFERLRKIVIPEIAASREEQRLIRVWAAGCSTGEEAYSIAIVIHEYLRKTEQDQEWKVQVFATDIDSIAIEKARVGWYPASIDKNVSEERLRNFFIAKGSGYQIKKEIRDMVIFAVQSVIKDPPFTRLDLIACRNLLIYMKPEIQKKLISAFHYALHKDGFLFLGASEGINGFGELFSPVEQKLRLFRRTNGISKLAEFSNFPHLPYIENTETKNEKMSVKKHVPGIMEAIQKSLIHDYAPPSLIINKNGEIVYVNGHTGRYLELPVGQASLNIFSMAREGLKFEIEAGLKELSISNTVVTRNHVKIKVDGTFVMVNLTLKDLGDSNELSGLVLIIIEEENVTKDVKILPGAESSPENKTIDELQTELEFIKKQYKNTLAEKDSSLEELTSVNEELQSINEELQSSNEELTTSKEEMQSLNEELVAVNSELNTKMTEFTQITNDMRNLLDSTQIATIFLDQKMNLKRFTPPASKIIKLITADIGRPITDIASYLTYANLERDIRKVLDHLSIVEQQVQTFDGTWFAMRISPYRTVDNYIEGVVITFTDISLHKQLDEEKFARLFAENIVNTVRHPLVVLDKDINILSVNDAFSEVFKIIPEISKGKNLFEVGDGQWDIPELKKLLQEILPQKNELKNFKVEHHFPSLGKRTMLLNARSIVNEQKERKMILLAFEDITEKANH
jgi:two-component system, chemotaxis family, CheB/CheR fusion protein